MFYSHKKTKNFLDKKSSVIESVFRGSLKKKQSDFEQGASACPFG
jgi:hypothetical protein